MLNLNSSNKIIITGAAGFIGFHLTKKLLSLGHQILGIDNLNNYYDINLKLNRLKKLKSLNNDSFSFSKVDITKSSVLKKIFSNFKPDKVINLAAQAGIRYSLKNPNSYVSANIKGFMNILECCRHFNVNGLIYASSSSVYGKNSKIPFSIEDRVNLPISIYAATKRANELMAHSYSHLFQLNTTGLRFFTVYGPWGRPDMAMYIFANKIHKGEPIFVFNNGDMKRDFTYIDDIISGIISAMKKNSSYDILNLGNSKSEKLMTMISLIEKSMGKKAKIKLTGMQLGDVKNTYADIKDSYRKIGYKPTTSISQGIPKFIKWFKEYHNC